MSKSVPALINPAMLVWARERARLTVEESARKIGITPERMYACEAGEALLTFAQFMRLAREYKRPLSLFYLKTPPSGWSPIQDFRKLPDVQVGFSPKLTYAIRLAHERRELALDLRAELNDPVIPFTLKVKLDQDMEMVGAEVRAYIGITEARQREWPRAKVFENWRAAIEAKDVLVFMVPRLPLVEMRGAALAETEFPVILINGKDRTGGRIFTLLHEFCHLAIHRSGVSSDGGDREGAPDPRLERFCNAVAAAALMPKDWLLTEQLVIQKGDAKTWSDEDLNALAGRFGVSREAMLRRLLTLGKTTATFYEAQRARFVEEYADLETQKSAGGPEYHIQVLSQLGRGFTRLVFQSYHERRLTLRDVSNYFNMQVRLVPELERSAYGIKG